MGNLICSKLDLYNENKITYLAKQMMKDVIEILKKVDDDIFIEATLHDKSADNPSTMFVTQVNGEEIRYLTCLTEYDYLGKSDLVDEILDRINMRVER